MRISISSSLTPVSPDPAYRPRCTACSLHEQAKHPCLGMRHLRLHGGAPQPRGQALLVVGQAPGYHEDQQQKVFAGPTSGILTDVYLHAFDNVPDLDVWATNAVKCMVPSEDNPKLSQIKRCNPYLWGELYRLSLHYQTVTVLCLGAVATRSVLGLNLKASFKAQGRSLPDHPTIRVFSTYHPAYISRNPAGIHAVESHLTLVADYLGGHNPLRGWNAPSSFSGILRREPPNNLGGWLALDIETYGKVEGLPAQTQFHPRKSVHHDGCPPANLIQTVALSWRPGHVPGCPALTDPYVPGSCTCPPSEIQSTIIPWDREGERMVFRWLTQVERQGTRLLLMNAQFDIQYLRLVSPLLRSILKPQSIPLWDLALTSYFDDPERPEGSLKDLSVIVGLGAYTEDPEARHPDNQDARLWAYNIEDTEKTLRIHEILSDRLNRESRPLLPYTLDFYSGVLWSLLEMSETGMALDQEGIARKSTLTQQGLETIQGRAEESCGLVLAGKGSNGSKQEALQSAADLCGFKLTLTGKTRQVQVTEEQINNVLGALTKVCRGGGKTGQGVKTQDPRPLTRPLRMMKAHAKLQKLLGTYLGPLVNGGSRRGQTESQMIHGLVYPVWYPCPTEMKDGAGGKGGTRQARPICRHPSAQTFPPAVKRFEVSRWGPEGFYLGVDYSQIELRLAALLSGDTLFMQEYAGKPDLHGRTATLFVEAGLTTQADLRNRWKFWRQLGKTVNFLVLYRGGGYQLGVTFEAAGVRASQDVCDRIIGGFYRRHTEFSEWQEGLIEEAITHHRLTLPLVGNVRRFEGTPAQIRKTYENEICNFPVQGTAALVVLSAQRHLQNHLTKRGMETRIVMNRYDALYLDGPRREEERVRASLGLLASPPYYRDLCRHLGRHVPLEYELQND